MKYIKYYENLHNSELFKKMVGLNIVNDWISNHIQIDIDKNMIYKLKDRYGQNIGIRVNDILEKLKIKIFHISGYDCITISYYDDNWILVETHKADDSWTIEYYLCDDEIGLFDCLDSLIK